MLFALTLVLALSVDNCLGASSCSGRDFKKGSVACVCNEQRCDIVDPITKSPRGTVQIFTTTKSGKRFAKTTKKFNEGSVPSGYPWKIKIDRTKKYQKIIGFGSSFSDAAVLGIGQMSAKLQKQILSDFFGPNGIEMNMIRTTIAGSDFSNRAYSYDDHFWDWNLTKFSLVDEDTKYRIPQLKLAKQVAKHKLKFFGSPWSGPAWLKTNQKLHGKGTLKEGPGSIFWKTYAKYILRWLQEYRKRGIEFWGMTVQNEPMTGFFDNWPWNTMGFTAEMEKNFVKTDLGPILEKAGWGPDKFNIMCMDHNRDLLPQWADTVLGDKAAARYVKGIALHWYANFDTKHGPEKLDQTLKRHPNHFILATEACEAPWSAPGSHIELGNWHYGETYAHDIIKDLTHSTSGWLDWNMVLDMTGGPHWPGHGGTASAPVIVNQKAKEYYKNPMFYAIGHFSKFLPPGSIRIGTSPEIVDNKKVNQNGGLQAAAFQRPDGGYVFIVINSWNDNQSFVLDDSQFGQLRVPIEAHSFNSWVYYP